MVYVFVLLINAFNLGPSFSTIAKLHLSISDDASASLSQRLAVSKDEPADQHKHPTRKFVSYLPVRACTQTDSPNFYFPISNFIFNIP